MSGAAQDGPAGQGPPQSVQSVLDAFQASHQRAFDALRTDLVAMVQAVEARTGQLELFVDGLKPGAGGGEQQSEALRQLRELWQADNERALATLRGELQQAEARFEGDWPAGDKRVRDELRGAGQRGALATATAGRGRQGRRPRRRRDTEAAQTGEQIEMPAAGAHCATCRPRRTAMGAHAVREPRQRPAVGRSSRGRRRRPCHRPQAIAIPSPRRAVHTLLSRLCS